MVTFFFFVDSTDTMKSVDSIGDDFDLADDVEMDVRVKLGDGSECTLSSKFAIYLKNFLHPGADDKPLSATSVPGPEVGTNSSSAVWTASVAAVGSFASSFTSVSSFSGANRGAGTSSSATSHTVSLNCGTKQSAEVVVEFYRGHGSSLRGGIARDQQQAAHSSILRRLQASPALALQVLELCHVLECTELFLAAAKVFGDIVQLAVKELGVCGAYPPTTTDHLTKCSSALQRAFGLPDERESATQLKELISYYDPKLPLQSQLTHSVTPEVFAQMRFQAAQRQASSVNDDNFAQKVLNLDPFRQRVWQPDAEATHCPGNRITGPCGKAFPTSYNFLWSGVTAEHCRCCGLRKCSACTNFLVDRSIARVVRPGSNDSENQSQQRRACKDCYLQAVELTKYLFLSRAFVFAKLHVPLINLMRCVNKQWRSAAELCLNEYRNRFYFHATVGSDVTREFAEIIRNTASLMVGHPQLVHLYFYVMDWRKPDEVRVGWELLEKTLQILSDRGKRFPPHSHWQLLCTRECASTSKEVFALQILFALQRAPALFAVADDQPRSSSHSSSAETSHKDDADDTCPQRAALAGIHHQLIDALCCVDGIHMCTAMTQLLLDLVTVTTCQAVCVPVLYEWVRRFQWIGIMLIQEVSSRPRSPTLQWLSTCSENSRVPRHDDRLLQSIPPERQAPFVMSMKVIEALVAAFSKKKPADAGEAQRALLSQLIKHGVVVGGDAVRVGEPLSVGSITGLHRFTFFFDPQRAGADIVGVKLGDIVVASSQARPVIIPFMDMHGKVRRVMYKAENLRKDFVVCTGAAVLQDLIAESNPQDKDVRNIPKYRVLPLTEGAGLVEMVEDCATVQDIIHTGSGGSREDKNSLLSVLRGSIVKHLKLMQQTSASATSSTSASSSSHHHLTPIQQVSRNFLLSAQFFILVNYVFAIGDRHRDNVMVSLRDGCIFHIDFGMIMNTKTLAETLTSQYVRFDEDIVDCIEAFASSASPPPPHPPGAQQHHHDPNQPQSLSTTSSSSARGGGGPSEDVASALARREAAINEFLSKTGEWFIAVRPHSSILFLLLGHLVRHRVLSDSHPVGGAAGPSLGQRSSMTEVSTTADNAGAGGGITTEQLLSRELRSIFVAGCTENEARRIFMDRVTTSIGKNWLKDLTYETRKRAKSIYAEFTSTLWSYWGPTASTTAGDDYGRWPSGSSTAFSTSQTNF